MKLAEAFAVLLEGYAAPKDDPCVQVLDDDRWREVPIEWNVAKRLADIASTQARILGRDGRIIAEYPSEEVA